MMEVVSGDNWSYKTCKAPVKSSSSTNQHPVFYKLDVLPVTQPTVSKHWRESYYQNDERKKTCWCL